MKCLQSYFALQKDDAFDSKFDALMHLIALQKLHFQNDSFRKVPSLKDVWLSNKSQIEKELPPLTWRLPRFCKKLQVLRSIKSYLDELISLALITNLNIFEGVSCFFVYFLLSASTNQHLHKLVCLLIDRLLEPTVHVISIK